MLDGENFQLQTCLRVTVKCTMRFLLLAVSLLHDLSTQKKFPILECYHFTMHLRDAVNMSLLRSKVSNRNAVADKARR